MSKPSLTILITGATAGIGRHAALHLAARGHHVLASGRKASALADLAAEARRAGHRLDVVTLDVTDRASIQDAVVEVERLTAGRGIDALVNNAGYGHPGPMAEVTDAELRKQFETNVFGLMAVTRAFLPQLIARRGRLVNLSSVGGRVTFPLFGAYHASKYAVEAMSDALRLELAAFGVGVAIIEPGPIQSEFSARAFEQAKAYGGASSAYAPVLARADEIKSVTDRQAAGPAVVSRAIEHAVAARRPRTRYVVPFTSRLLVFLLRVLPIRWTDALARRVLGLTPAGLGLDGPRALPARG
jgi:short-subunit dehydrogenase